MIERRAQDEPRKSYHIRRRKREREREHKVLGSKQIKLNPHNDRVQDIQSQCDDLLIKT